MGIMKINPIEFLSRAFIGGDVRYLLDLGDLPSIELVKVLSRKTNPRILVTVFHALCPLLMLLCRR